MLWFSRMPPPPAGAPRSTGLQCRGFGRGPQLHWHMLPRVAGSTPGPEPSQEALTGQALTGPYGHTVTVAYINRQGGLRIRRMLQLARHLLLWSQKHLRSLRAIHIPGLLNRAADELSRAALPGEWRLHPQTAQLIERLLIASCLLLDRGNTRHGMHWHSAGRGAPASMRSPPVSLLAQTLCKIREDEEQVLLVAPYWPTRT